ncbi:MAG: DUF192 domain-containing protein [Syntrophomonadaceae bacterium]|nr:DUF192 domain-containing protein [Syntrophomonadaceae bacterium]
MGYLICEIKQGLRVGTIGSRVELANGFFTRFRGLLGRTGLAEGEGMLLSPCSSIHCFGMKFPIDVIFLDHNYYIVDLERDMQPGSHASCRKARFVLELKAGEIEKHNLQIGQQLEFSPIE